MGDDWVVTDLSGADPPTNLAGEPVMGLPIFNVYALHVCSGAL